MAVYLENGNFMWYEEDIYNKILKDFCELGIYLNLKIDPKVEHSNYISDIYLSNNNPTLQLEIDWRERVLFMYAITNIKHTEPKDEISKKYIEDIYCKVNYVYSKKEYKKVRYTDEFLYCLMKFYINIIKSNPMPIKDFLE